MNFTFFFGGGGFMKKEKSGSFRQPRLVGIFSFLELVFLGSIGFLAMVVSSLLIIHLSISYIILISNHE